MSRYHTIQVKVKGRKTVRISRFSDRKYLIDFRGIRKNGILNGDPQGQQRAFTSPEALQVRCDEYFSSCYNPVRNKAGEIIKTESGTPLLIQTKPFTISGLSYFLGIPTNSLRSYCLGVHDDLIDGLCEDKKLSVILNKARQRIGEYVETRLYDKEGQYGARFVMDCAFGWVNSKEMAEIVESRALTLLKQKEFQLKKKLIDDEENGDTNLTVNIVRANKSED